MREMFIMQIKNKKGFTLIEVLLTVTMLSVLIISVCFMYKEEINNLNLQTEGIEDMLFVENVYQLFTANPDKFNENVDKVYKLQYENGLYTYKNFNISMLEDEEYIVMIIYKNNKEVERWERKKIS